MVSNGRFLFYSLNSEYWGIVEAMYLLVIRKTDLNTREMSTSIVVWFQFLRKKITSLDEKHTCMPNLRIHVFGLL